MTETKKIDPLGEREQAFLRKLDKLSQKSREAALTRWNAYLDGMIAQERLTAVERDGA